MTNNIVALYQATREYNGMTFESAVAEEEFTRKQEAQWTEAFQSSSDTGKRLALATIKAAITYNDSYDPEKGSHTLDQPEAAAQHTDDPYEAMLIGIALNGWWNDILHVAFKTLGLDINGDWSKQISAYEHLDTKGA